MAQCLQQSMHWWCTARTEGRLEAGILQLRRRRTRQQQEETDGKTGREDCQNDVSERRDRNVVSAPAGLQAMVTTGHAGAMSITSGSQA